MKKSFFFLYFVTVLCRAPCECTGIRDADTDIGRLAIPGKQDRLGNHGLYRDREGYRYS